MRQTGVLAAGAGTRPTGLRLQQDDFEAAHGRKAPPGLSEQGKLLWRGFCTADASGDVRAIKMPPRVIGELLVKVELPGSDREIHLQEVQFKGSQQLDVASALRSLVHDQRSQQPDDVPLLLGMFPDIDAPVRVQCHEHACGFGCAMRMRLTTCSILLPDIFCSTRCARSRSHAACHTSADRRGPNERRSIDKGQRSAD